MKKMTCQELGGACDLEFETNTFEELVELSKNHGMAMFQSGDPAHSEAAHKIMALMMDPTAMEQWWTEKKNQFDALPDQ